MVQVNQHLRYQLRTAQWQLEEQARVIEQQRAVAHTDPLTGVANRRAFHGELSAQFEEFTQDRQPLSLVLIDIDHFKQFNDQNGHQAGDAVLQGVAKVLQDTLGADSVVARYGGEEFAAILRHTKLSDAKDAAERLRLAIANHPIEYLGRTLKVTASSGVSEARRGESPEQMLRRADEALYASKRAGRNCAHIHDGERCLAVTDLRGRKVRPQPVKTLASAEFDELAHHAADARSDALTGLPNRQAFSDILRQRVAEMKRYPQPLSLVIVDLDYLSKINERLGQSVGNVALRAVAQVLRTATREMDVLARFEGGAFAVLLPGAMLEDAVSIAERIRNAVSLCRVRSQKCELQIACSIGIATCGPADDSVTLMKRATLALLVSKRAGRNCSHAFHDGVCLPAKPHAPATTPE
jgi:diguanylate cyclase